MGEHGVALARKHAAAYGVAPSSFGLLFFLGNIYWVILSKKKKEGRSFPRTGRDAPRDFPRAKPEGNHNE